MAPPNDGSGLSQVFWGANWWLVLNACAVANSGVTSRYLLMDLVGNLLPYVLPCGDCRGHYKRNLQILYFNHREKETRFDVAWFMCDLHNLLNSNSGKKKVRYSPASYEHCFTLDRDTKYWALVFFFRSVLSSSQNSLNPDPLRCSKAKQLVSVVCYLLSSDHSQKYVDHRVSVQEAESSSVRDFITSHFGPLPSPHVNEEVFRGARSEGHRVDHFVWMVKRCSLPVWDNS